MTLLKDIGWFKQNFATQIAAQVSGTVFDVDMLTAIACQETGELWRAMRKQPLTPEEIVARCCGDTLDADKGRRAFPATKEELLAVPKGDVMFEIARAALLEMAKYVPGYGFAKTNKRKFCRGYGVFQYDLQFFRTNPSYFLDKKYETFDGSLGRALGELKQCLAKVGLDGKKSISDEEFARVAIAYNRGSYDPRKGLKQGHKSGGKFYGEMIAEYLAISRTVPASHPAQLMFGAALLPASPEHSASGPRFVVDTMISTLRLRSEPRISTPPTRNVVADLPDGHEVRAFGSQKINGFLEVEAELGGTIFRGYLSADYLRPLAGEPATGALPAQPVPSIPAVQMPRPAGSVTMRSKVAGAHSLNEPNMPGRPAGDAAALRKSLAEIIGFLSPESPTHLRYKPRAGLTFCNIFAHDYCTLAGVYLPRVWWTPSALLQLAQGNDVRPLYGNTIAEMRANDLFRWLRDFGGMFGWRQAGSTDEAQLHANRGGIALIVARRKEDGRSGHIVAIVPETDRHKAIRDQALVVTSPLQSQAGARNFNYGTGAANWWKGNQFAESAFWLHA